MAANARALSISRFSRFDEQEKSVQKLKYKTFFTSNEPTVYNYENRFEGKSNYMRYYPTGQTFEQEMEKFWWDNKNKELADKRRDEEAKQTMNEWGCARGRMESEIARKKEHLNVATNFEKARGWTRKNFKTKGMAPAMTEEEFMQPSSEDEEAEMLDEGNEPESAVKLESRKFSENKVAPSVIDMTEDAVGYGVRPATTVLSAQLNAIEEHNTKLPPKKKKKESLPEIVAPNVVCKTMMVRDFKKGSNSYVKKYQNVGLVDQQASLAEPDLREGVSAFSVHNQTKQL